MNKEIMMIWIICMQIKRRYKMNNSILKDLLKQYEQKRLNSIRDAEKRKKDLYLSNPKLQKIDDKLNSISITAAKNLLKNNSKNTLNDLKNQIENLKKEKEHLLKSLNVPLDYLLPKYDCEICKDTGYVFENGKSLMCNCLKQQIYNIEYNEKNLSSISNQTFENFNINLFSDKVDEKKYNSSISPRENIIDIKEASHNFVLNFENPKTKNLLFSGGTGLGKTYLSNCIVNELIKKDKTVMYQTAPVMLDNLIADLFAKPENQNGISKNLLSADLLVIDDLGTETMNSMKFTELYKIINTRLLNPKIKTIISTNLDLKGLFKTYDERLASRFVGYYDIYKFFGEDIRLKK